MSLHTTTPARPRAEQRRPRRSRLALRALRRGRFLALALPLLAGACDDPTDVPDHLVIEGVAIRDATTELFRYTLDDGTAVPTLSLPVGTHEVAFVMLDEEGRPIPHDEHGEEEGEVEHAFTVTILDPDVLAWTPEDHGTGEEHENLEFHGELEALTPGSTTLQVCVPHGDHCEIEIPGGIPVTVTQ